MGLGMTQGQAYLHRLDEADARLGAFLRAWMAARGSALVPSKSAFDPLEVPQLLSFIFLYRYEEEAGDFVCRLAGESVNKAWGHSIRGKSLREVVGAHDYPTIRSRWDRIVGDPLVHYGANRERLSEQNIYRADRLLMPLYGDDTGRLDHVVGVSLYQMNPVSPSRPPLLLEDIHRIQCADL